MNFKAEVAPKLQHLVKVDKTPTESIHSCDSDSSQTIGTHQSPLSENTVHRRTACPADVQQRELSRQIFTIGHGHTGLTRYITGSISSEELYLSLMKVSSAYHGRARVCRRRRERCIDGCVMESCGPCMMMWCGIALNQLDLWCFKMLNQVKARPIECWDSTFCCIAIIPDLNPIKHLNWISQLKPRLTNATELQVAFQMEWNKILSSADISTIYTEQAGYYLLCK